MNHPLLTQTQQDHITQNLSELIRYYRSLFPEKIRDTLTNDEILAGILVNNNMLNNAIGISYHTFKLTLYQKFAEHIKESWESKGFQYWLNEVCSHDSNCSCEVITN